MKLPSNHRHRMDNEREQRCARAHVTRFLTPTLEHVRASNVHVCIKTGTDRCFAQRY